MSGKYSSFRPGRGQTRSKRLAYGAQRARLRAAVRAVRRPSFGRVRRAAQTMLNQRTAGFLGIENKFYDTTLTSTALTAPTDASGGEVDPSATSMISTPAVGDSEQNRDGKRIVIQSVQVEGTVRTAPLINQTAVTGPVEVFVALVLDTQTNAAQLNSEDVFKNLSGAAGQAAQPLRNLLFGPRFRVIQQWKMMLDPKIGTYDGTNIELGAAAESFSCFKKLMLPVNFNAGTTASVANVIDNSLHLIAYCSANTLSPAISYNARIRFQG